MAGVRRPGARLLARSTPGRRFAVRRLCHTPRGAAL
jgi:hypothetical protein